MKKRTIDAVALMDAMHEKEFVEWHPLDEIDAVINEAPTVLPDLNDLRNEIYRDAIAHGLWEDDDGKADELSSNFPDDIRPGERLRFLRDLAAKRILQEVNELCEAADNNYAAGFVDELADVIITGLSVAGHLGIDIDAALHKKVAYNKTRPFKHKGESKGEGHG